MSLESLLGYHYAMNENRKAIEKLEEASKNLDVTIKDREGAVKILQELKEKYAK